MKEAAAKDEARKQTQSTPLIDFIRLKIKDEIKSFKLTKSSLETNEKQRKNSEMTVDETIEKNGETVRIQMSLQGDI